MKTPRIIGCLLGACLPFLAPLGCSVDEQASEESEGALGQKIFGLSDFEVAPTLHLGETVEDNLAVKQGKIAHPFYVGADLDHPVEVRASVAEVAKLTGEASNTPITISVLAPPDQNGERRVIATATRSISAILEQSGQYMFVIGAKKKQQTARVILDSRVIGAGKKRNGAIVNLAHGQLVGKNTLSVRLNAGLPDSNVELWSGAPMPLASEAKRKIGSVKTVNHVANFVLDGAVKDGDDLTVVVPSKEGPAYDTGTLLRYWTKENPGLRMDRIRTSVDEQGVNIDVTGVLDFFEGYSDLEIRSMERLNGENPLVISTSIISRVLPGQSGLGLSMIDESFTIPLGKQATPRSGEILAVGITSEIEPYAFTKLGCFKFDQVKSAPVACPSPEGAWTDIEEAFSLDLDEEHSITIPDVPAGTYTFQTRGSGDADLYVKLGGAATKQSWDCRPYLGGSAERCTINVKTPSTIGVMVHGYKKSVVELIGKN